MSTNQIIALTSLGLLAVGSAGYFWFSRDVWVFYFFAHLGALGLMGLAGSAAGALARWKRRSYATGFSLGAVLPIALGAAAVLVYRWGVSGQLHCGGSVCLGAALLIILSYLLVRKRTRPVESSIS